MQRDHRPRLSLGAVTAFAAAAFAFLSFTGPAQAQAGPVVEVLDDGGSAQDPVRYDARQPRRQAGPLTVRRPNVQQPNVPLQPPPPTVIVVPEPRLTPPMTPAPRPDRRERRRGNGYLAFGAQSGVFLGIGAGLALALAGDQERRGATLGAVAAPLLSAVLAGLLRRWARNDHWREAPGHVLSGLYPGAIQGALFAGSIMEAFDLEGQERKRTLGLAIGATALLSMVLHGNAAEAAPKRAGLYYATLAIAALVTLPFAVAFDEPKAVLYGTTAAGAAHLVLTGMAPTLRW